MANYPYQTQGFTLNDSGRRVVVDPITRIEGHLRIEVNVDENNVIRNAVSTGTMWRGLEVILKGRDPRDAWAFVERICGVCTGTHALSSVRAVEDALGIVIPKNANIIRNLMLATLYAQDHLVHFYHLHALDWVDIVSALNADPRRTSQLQQSISSWRNSSPGYFRDVQNRLKKFVESGQLGIFANAYWGHPAYRLPPEANLMAVTHYLEALDFQTQIVKIHTIFGGKNPHPNWLVGGVPSPINIDGAGSVGAVNEFYLNIVRDICDQTIEFIEKVYIPDLTAIAGFYKDWTYGGGISSQNLMSYGEFPITPGPYENGNLLVPSGVILNGNLNEVLDVDLKDREQIQEWVTHSWYKYADESKGLHPFDGVTEPNFELGNIEGSRTNIQKVDENAKYSWVKAPRWRGQPMEVGPLARYVVAYARGDAEIVGNDCRVSEKIGRFERDAIVPGRISTGERENLIARYREAAVFSGRERKFDRFPAHRRRQGNDSMCIGRLSSERRRDRVNDGSDFPSVVEPDGKRRPLRVRRLDGQGFERFQINADFPRVDHRVDQREIVRVVMRAAVEIELRRVRRINGTARGYRITEFGIVRPGAPDHRVVRIVLPGFHLRKPAESPEIVGKIGGGGLGRLIFMGLAMMDAQLMFIGAFPTALLAIATDIALGRVEKILTGRHKSNRYERSV